MNRREIERIYFGGVQERARERERKRKETKQSIYASGKEEVVLL